MKNNFNLFRMISKLNAVIFLLLLIFVPLVITYVYKDLSEPLKEKILSDSINPTPTITPTPSFTPGALFELKKSKVLVKSNEIEINPYFFDEDQKKVTLTEQEYPGLFSNQYIIPSEIYDSVNDKTFLLITSNSDRGGSYQPYAFVVIDPNKGKVVYDSPDEFGMNDQSLEYINGSVFELFMENVYVYDTCGNCSVGILEFVAYDPILEKFVPVNSRYRSYFQKRVSYYNEILNTQKCIFKEKEGTLSELYTMYGAEATCLENYPKDDTSIFTIGEFIKLRDKTQEIVSGTRATLVSY